MTIEREHVDRYAAVCGFPTKDTVPLPYPHLLAFELQMGIMTDPGFPAPAIGTVHLENSITQHRPLAVGETVDVTASVGPSRPHPKGTVYDFVTVVTAGGETVWEETSSYLRRGKGDDGAPAGAAFPDAAPHGIVWKLPGRPRPHLRRGLGRPQPDPPLRADRQGVRLPAPDRARHVDDGPLRRGPGEPDPRRGDASTSRSSGRCCCRARSGSGRRRSSDGFAFNLTSPKDGSPHLVGRTTSPL